MFKVAIKMMLEALAKGQIEFVSPTPEQSVKSDRQRSTAFYPPQFHPFTEIIFALSGKSLVYKQADWLPTRLGSTLIFLPGALHSERYFRRNVNYQLLWTTITSQSVNFHITSWTSALGYHLPHSRISLRVSSNEKLAKLFADDKIKNDRVLQINAQAILMELLCESLAKMDSVSTSKIPHNRKIAEQIRHYLDHHYQSEISLQELAQMVHYSTCHLNMLFRKEIGTPIKQYILKKRLEQAEHLLLSTNMEVKQIAYQVGFTDPLYFSRLFRKHFGQSPTKFEHATE